MARLLRLVEDGTRRTWQIGAGLLLGRGADCDVVVTDVAASRHHARLTPSAEGFLLEDQTSANGTWVGEERVTRRVLGEGERFRVGASWFAVESESPPHAVARPRRSAALVLVLGCVGVALLATVAAVAGLVLWELRAPTRSASALPAAAPPPDDRPSARPDVSSVPLAEANLLRFTLRLAANPVPKECASMPARWVAPSLVVPVASPVRDTAWFDFHRAWSDARGDHDIEGTGQWEEEKLSVRGIWKTHRKAGPEQTDEGTFEATGQRLLGSWFGDRAKASFVSRLDGASCGETIGNADSRVESLLW